MYHFVFHLRAYNNDFRVILDLYLTPHDHWRMEASRSGATRKDHRHLMREQGFAASLYFNRNGIILEFQDVWSARNLGAQRLAWNHIQNVFMI